MVVVPLRRHPSGALSVLAKLEYRGFRCARTFVFLVDTGADGTIILPNTLKAIERELTAARRAAAKKVSFDGRKRQYETLFGEATYTLADDFKLIVPQHPNAEVAINCSVSLLTGTLAKRAKGITYNLLGRNVLERYVLYMDRPGIKTVVPGCGDRPIAFLAQDGETLNRTLASSDPTIKAFLDQMGAPPPEDIEWID